MINANVRPSVRPCRWKRERGGVIFQSGHDDDDNRKVDSPRVHVRREGLGLAERERDESRRKIKTKRHKKTNSATTISAVDRAQHV